MSIFFLLSAVLPVLPAVSQATAGQADIQKLSRDKLPRFSDDLDLARLSPAIQSSLAYYEKLPDSREFEFAGQTYRSGELKAGLSGFLAFLAETPAQTALNKWITRHFHVYAVTRNNKPGGMLYTGYYIPVLNGSRDKTDKYRYPVYPRPSDLVTFKPSDFCKTCPQTPVVGRCADGGVVPYYTRQTIESRPVLKKTAAPIVWVDDPVDLFFLHVQGSGIVRLPSGERINVHYTASNGHPYKSIGRYLIHKGKIARKNLTMQSLRRYLENHPEKQAAIFAHNPRYVFFKEAPGGPAGCLDVELTPGRSIAMDQSVYPRGTLAFIQTEKPVLDQSGKVKKWQPFSRFVLNQDTGDAIRGIGRVDIFWGGGHYAETAAGRLKHPGKLFILLPK
ncbi:MAG: MltA domain-containing protein [Desulfobacterales bacterium]|nr:MltA domain-containing protein [Desulfobacterales bacterium]